MAASVDEQVRILGAGAVDLITEADLRRKLATGRPLRAKLGIDPTASDIHLGFAVVLRKLRQFQELGHVAVLIIGDFTAQVGDPTGKSATRPRLTKEEVAGHAATYIEQVSNILAPDNLEIRRNSEWLATMGIEDVLRLTARTTVARMLERDDFAKRLRDGVAVSVMELLYPLLQGWDSVMVEADVELGGTDQLYNLLAGREIMEAYGLDPQVVLTTPLLLSWDGEKMSSSVGNNIPLTAPPEEMFGRTMRVPDELLPEWYRLVWERKLPAGADPLEAKLELARFIVRRSHGEGAVRRAEDHFTRVVREGRPPDEAELPEVSVDGGSVYLPELLSSQFGQTNSHWRRVIEQGGVKVDGQAVHELELPAERLAGTVIQAGKRQFVKVSPAAKKS
jgi:tyrosyl-tRNA synthetase